MAASIASWVGLPPVETVNILSAVVPATRLKKVLLANFNSQYYNNLSNDDNLFIAESNAIKEIATQKSYDAVIDRASAQSMIFASPRIDISNEVLARLGYSN